MNEFYIEEHQKFMMPCPFCGSIDLSLLQYHHEFSNSVYCNLCGYSKKCTKTDAPSEVAARHVIFRNWNTRSMFGRLFRFEFSERIPKIGHQWYAFEISPNYEYGPHPTINEMFVEIFGKGVFDE